MLNRDDCEVCSGTGSAFGKACPCVAAEPPPGTKWDCAACHGNGISWGKPCPCRVATTPLPGDSIDTPLFRAVLRNVFGTAAGDWPRPELAAYINKWADLRAAATSAHLAEDCELRLNVGSLEKKG
jgi:hypothetical protein